jgi:hypothetical protein
MLQRRAGHHVEKAALFGAFLGFCLTGALSSSARAADPAPAASTAAAVNPLDEVYVYNAPSRDPFVPLTGAAASADMGGAGADAVAGAFNPSSVELKGIIRTRTGRWAVLSGSSGERYVVENGKIRDAKKKAVEGFVGIIKEKTLVLIGPNNQVTELKLKRDMTDEDRAKPKKS